MQEFNIHITLNVKNPADNNLPQWRRLYQNIKTAILHQYLKPDTRLPATRKLATNLNVSRNTIATAFDQLIAEGYLVTKQGSGTFVANIAPDQSLFVTPKNQPDKPAKNQKNLSNRGTKLSTIKRPNFTSGAISNARNIPFQSGLPDLSQFPKAEFAKLLSQSAKTSNEKQLDYDYQGGLPDLKQAISSYLSASRGVNCNPEQVLIISGSQAALDLTARLLLDENDPIWFENPGYGGAHSALNSAGAIFHPLPIVDDIHDFEKAIKACPNPKLAYVTPSHQHPTGATMSLKQRQTLLKLADEHDFWIIEDDYDSEYRYEGRPIPALQGLDRSNRTIYIGTFSKILSPALRCAYIILPESLVNPFNAALFNSGMSVPSFIQIAMANFIQSGQFLTHIRKMRILYNQRRLCLLDAIKAHLSNYITPMQNNAGMHFAVRITHPILQKLGDAYLVEMLQKNNIATRSFSAYSLKTLSPQQQGLLLGFAPFSEKQLTQSSIKMATIFSEIINRHSGNKK